MNRGYAVSSLRFSLAVVAISASALLAGCADAPDASDPEAVTEYNRTNDPLEPWNRGVYDANARFDRHVFKPAAEGYRDYVPEDIRGRLHDFVTNLRAPVVFANDLLQLDPGLATDTFSRFVVNTTVGFGGFCDVAVDFAPRHDNDLGKTLGVWGVGEGPFLMLPLFGPSNPRDLFGLAVESYADPLDRYASNMGYMYVTFIRGAVAGIDRRTENLDQLDEIERTSVDPYSTLRSLYRQYRQSLIEGHPVADKPHPGLTGEFPNNDELSQETN